MKHLFFCLLTISLFSFSKTYSQSIIQKYTLGKSRDINVTNGVFFDNGGKDGHLINEYFVTTIHCDEEIEIFFEELNIPIGSRLNFYEGKSVSSKLVGTVTHYEKISNISGKDITIEYLPTNVLSMTFSDFKGEIRKLTQNGKRGGQRSQPESDCPYAIPLCQNLTAVALGGKYTDLGSVSDDSGGCYGGTGSGGSVWYSFQPQADGPLDFSITPTGTTDYDFVLWDITSGCASNQRKEISCNYSLITGATGLSSTLCNQAGGSCTTNDCTTDSKGSDCNKFNRRPSVLASHKYAVCINFYSGSNDGFTIQFKNEASSVNITDITPPTIINASANSCPSASQFHIRFSEYIDCTTLQASDLTLPGHTITINNTNCANNTTNNIDITITPALTSGTYSLHAQDILDLCGNNMNSNFDIVIGATPTPTINGNKTTCKSPGFLGIGFTYTPSSQSLTAGGGSFYQWSDGQIGATVSVSPTTTTTYTVTVTQGACPATASSTVTVETSPVISIPDQNICSGSSKTLTATGGGTYQWYTNPTLLGNGTTIPAPNGTAPSLTVSPSATTTYRVVVTSPGGCKGQDDVKLTIVTTGCCDATIAPAGPYCTSDTNRTLIAGTPGGIWRGAGIIDSVNGKFSPSTSGVGTFKVYYILSCGASDSTTITVQACSVLAVCKETNGNLTVSGGISPYTWEKQTTSVDCSSCFGGSCSFLCAGTTVTNWTNFGSTSTVTPPGTWPIRVRDAAGTIIQIASLAAVPACSLCPTISITTSNAVQVKCNGQSNGSFTASATGGASPYSYILKNGTTTVATFTGVSGLQNFTGLASGTYSISVTDNNSCSGSNTITITQPNALSVIIPPTTSSSCGQANGAATSNVSGGTTPYTYLWSNSGQNSGISNVAQGNYILTVTDANLCSATATAVISSSSSLGLSLTATPTGCIPLGKAKVTVTSGTGPFSYIWSNGQTTDSTTGLSAGIVKVTVTGAGGCSSSDSVTITSSITLPNINAGTDTPLNCIRTSLILQASSSTSGVTFLWSNGKTTTNDTVIAPNIYSVTATNPLNGCTASDQVVVAIDTTSPNAYAGLDKILLCGTASVTLDGSSTTPNVNFTWSNGLGNTASTSASIAGTYTLIVTGNLNGCSASDQVDVSLDANAPVSDAGQNASITCVLNSSGTVQTGTSSTNGYTYAWSPNTGLSQSNVSNPTVSPLSTTTYTVTTTNTANGCASQAVVTITVDRTAPNADAGQPKVLTCNITSITLDGSSTTPNATFNWSSGLGSNPSATATATGTYTLVVTDPVNGCTASDQVDVTLYNTPPNLSIQTPVDISCVNPTVTLTASSTTAGVSYNWSAGSTNATQDVTLAGPYTVTATDNNNGCTAEQTVNVNAQPSTIYSIATTAATCGNSNGTATINIASGSGSYSYAWNTGDATISISSISGGQYIATVTDVNGCKDVRTATVSQTPQAIKPDIGEDKTICEGELVVLNAGKSYVTYKWQDNTTDNIYNATNEGLYSVTIMDNNGCEASDTMELKYRDDCSFEIAVPTAFSPNGDGRNDVFKAAYIGTATSFELRVFNRWGEKVFETKDVNTGWDGRYKGADAPFETYTWYIKYKYGTDKEKSLIGNLSLLR